jgi:predicted dehydrogenase
MSEFRVGIVGAVSSYTFIFAEALEEAPDITYAGLAHLGRDPDYIKASLNLPWLEGKPKTIEDYAQVYDVPVYETMAELIDKGQVDGICVTTEDYLHQHYALRALEAGAHVFIPKPFATSRQEAETMFQAARKHGLILRGSLPNRFEPTYIKTNELIEAGAIGRPLLGHFHQEHHLSLGGWKSDPTMAGGPAYEMGFYTLDAMRWLMKSEPMTMTAYGANLDHQGIPYIDNATCSVQYANEAMASGDLCFSLHHRFLGHAGLDIIGDEGALVWERGADRHDHIIAIHDRSGVQRFEPGPRGNYKGGEMLDWVRMCREDADTTYWNQECLRTLDFIKAFKTAYQTGDKIWFNAQDEKA